MTSCPLAADRDTDTVAVPALSPTLAVEDDMDTVGNVLADAAWRSGPTTTEKNARASAGAHGKKRENRDFIQPLPRNTRGGGCYPLCNRKTFLDHNHNLSPNTLWLL